mmetsp:Transcript_12197/g.40174  ORF Transcript_12197/g.40174 Transcript_12197/m.40174 type:complete len:250 (-) Transcript_12197:1368-2117(-)
MGCGRARIPRHPLFGRRGEQGRHPPVHDRHRLDHHRRAPLLLPPGRLRPARGGRPPRQERQEHYAQEPDGRLHRRARLLLLRLRHLLRRGLPARRHRRQRVLRRGALQIHEALRRRGPRRHLVWRRRGDGHRRLVPHHVKLLDAHRCRGGRVLHLPLPIRLRRHHRDHRLGRGRREDPVPRIPHLLLLPHRLHLSVRRALDVGPERLHQLVGHLRLRGRQRRPRPLRLRRLDGCKGTRASDRPIRRGDV